MKEKFFAWLPALLLAGTIFYISSWPGTTVESLGLGKESYHVDGHFILFFFLTIALYKATKDVKKSAAMAFIYGILDELHQKFVPGRSPQLFDIWVDGVGIFLAGLILWKYFQRLPRILRSWLEK